MGEARTNLKKGSAAERLTDYLNYILGLVNQVNRTVYALLLSVVVFLLGSLGFGVSAVAQT